jgi:hypothetical protein
MILSRRFAADPAVRCFEEFRDAYPQPSWDCFMCGHTITDPAVMWQGTCAIFFHQRCALHFQLEIARDCHSVERLLARDPTVQLLDEIAAFLAKGGADDIELCK